MNYQPICAAQIPFASEQQKANWEQLMLSEKRDWRQILDTCNDALARYISAVRVAAIKSKSAAQELKTLCSVYNWEEYDFSLDWEVDVYYSETHPIKYESFAEFQQALLGEKEPDIAASDAWNQGGLELEFEWSDATNPTLKIKNLSLK